MGLHAVTRFINVDLELKTTEDLSALPHVLGPGSPSTDRSAESPDPAPPPEDFAPSP